MAINPTIFYRDSVIEAAFIMDYTDIELKSLALRYIEPGEVLDKEGSYLHTLTNSMSGATDWFILPDTLGKAVAKKLFELYCTGLNGFVEDQITSLRNWLIENNELEDSMCY